MEEGREGEDWEREGERDPTFFWADLGKHDIGMGFVG